MFDNKSQGKKSANKRRLKHAGRIPMSTRPPKIIESKKRKHEQDQNNRELKDYLKN